MSQQELLKRVIQILEDSRIEYMITGSVVSSLQGEPRATHDIDILVHISKTVANTLLKEFSAIDFYIDKESILKAIEFESMFNVIDINSGDKIDFWILKDELFDQSRFSRKYKEEFMGIKMQVSRPEDTILAKLRWMKLSGGSEKQFIDALRVYEVQLNILDQTYLEYWAQKLEIESELQRMYKESKKI